MFPGVDERAPLLQFPASYGERQDEPVDLPDAYKQFCQLIGNCPADHPPGKKHNPPKDSLYYRAVNHRRTQGRMYYFTSTLTNTLLLSQVVLGATLTGLGASDQSRVLITIFGALNTVIAGLVAFLKSRGQPMRARMFRDDLDRVVDEIENSAVMWKGISSKVHGYNAIDTDESVTVRSEVARLTRLYDRAVKTNTMNDPDFYGSGISNENVNSGLRARSGQTLLPVVQPPAPPTSAAPVAAATPGTAPVPALGQAPPADPDESPATKPPAPPPRHEEPVKSPGDIGDSLDITKAVQDKPELAKNLLNTIEGAAAPASPTTEPTSAQPQASSSAPAAPPTSAPIDPDESPATSAKLIGTKAGGKTQGQRPVNNQKVTASFDGN